MTTRKPAQDSCTCDGRGSCACCWNSDSVVYDSLVKLDKLAQEMGATVVCVNVPTTRLSEEAERVLLTADDLYIR
jgi:hypothetical protein